MAQIILINPDPNITPITLEIPKRKTIELEGKRRKTHITANTQAVAEYTYEYARYIVKGRWTEAEPIIKQDPEYAYWYALDVVGGRWLEAEPTIIKDPYYAYCYARDVVKDRWLEAEPTIMKNPKWAERYTNIIMKGDSAWLKSS